MYCFYNINSKPFNRILLQSKGRLHNAGDRIRSKTTAVFLLIFLSFKPFNRILLQSKGRLHNAGDRIRTYVGTKPAAPKAAPFDHSGTPASIKRVIDEPKNIGDIWQLRLI